MAARGIGGATDRDSLSTRDANGATMLMEEDTAALKRTYVWVSLPDTINLLSRLLHHKYSLSATRWGPGRPGRDERTLKV